MAGPTSTLARALREPLVRFLLIGAALFAVDRALAGSPATPDDAHLVVVTRDFVEGLREQHRARTGALPDDGATEALVGAYVREEVLYREARAAALDAGDLVVRRRLVQKMEFELAGSLDLPEPDDDALRARLDDDALRLPATTTLTHVFFARDRRPTTLRADAEAARAILRDHPDRERPDALGDPFLRGATLVASTDAQLDAALGAGFSAAVAALALDTWSEPLESAYGLHLVRVDARTPARSPALDEARERLRREWLHDAREEALERAIAERVASYRVVRE